LIGYEPFTALKKRKALGTSLAVIGGCNEIFSFRTFVSQILRYIFILNFTCINNDSYLRFEVI